MDRNIVRGKYLHEKFLFTKQNIKSEWCKEYFNETFIGGGRAGENLTFIILWIILGKTEMRKGKL